MKIQDLDKDILSSFRKGCVIPAVPLALDEKRKFDEKHQKALIRYYIDAGVGGLAVGVHSTQFEIREHGMFEQVLSTVSAEIDSWASGRKILKVAGVCGKTEQAVREASFAVSAGYHACLLSLAALKESSVEDLLSHCRQVAAVMPVIGFYLQASVGGMVLPYEFWREFATIPNVLGIKMAPFNRYRTFDVVRAVCDANKENEITLYTGNDDNIVPDLLTEYAVSSGNEVKKVRIKGGLLGHWCVWTRKAVELLDEIHALLDSGKDIPHELLTRGIQITDTNAAFFDTANNFAGCIPGLHEVLRRQGLFKGTWCLNLQEVLSPGQYDEITRIYKAYPHLNDDAFVSEHLSEWLK